MTAKSIRQISKVVGLIVLLATVLPAPASAESEKARYVVILEDSVENPGSLARVQVEQRNGKLGFVYRHALKGYSAELPKGAVEGLRRSPRVELVAPDREVETFAQSIPTGIDRVFATSNANLDVDGVDDVRIDADVAVIDTGTDHEHPDLDVVSRTDCSNGTEKEASCVNESGTDTNGHGTHVAGTAAAVDNGEGVVGVAPGARLWAVKALGSGTNYDSEIAAGIDWVTARASQIEVVNMSLGCFCELPLTAKAIEGSVKAGVVHVVAAGNNLSDAKFVAPANHPDVITVSALADFDGQEGAKAESTECREVYESEWGPHSDDSFAIFSNDGSKVEVAAPGVCIRSTVPSGGYAEAGWWGTSMASPHVAGAAAVLASQSDPKTKAHVEAIRSKIVAKGNSNWNDTSGDGVKEPLLDVKDELAFWIPGPPMAITEAAKSVGIYKATLSGSILPKGYDTTYHYEYGTTAEYGTSVPVLTKMVAGSKGLQLRTQGINGLEPETTYHYRLVATNEKGTSHGKDLTFTTATAGPVLFKGHGQIEGEQAPHPFHGEWFNAWDHRCEAPSFDVAGLFEEATSTLTTTETQGSLCPEGAGLEPGHLMVMNGCQVTFEPEAEAEEGTFYGTLSFGPAECGPIEKWYWMAPPECEFLVDPLSIDPIVKYTNMPDGSISIRMEAWGIEATSPNCLPPPHSISNSGWIAYWVMKSSGGEIVLSG